jgi:hypothetical protein
VLNGPNWWFPARAVCKQEKNNGETYCTRVLAQWCPGGKAVCDANGPLFEAEQFGQEAFSVVHFAGPVRYGTTEVDKVNFKPPSMWSKNNIDPNGPMIDSFLTKNKDKVPQSLLEFFANSTNEYYQHITRARSAGQTTVGSSKTATAAKTIVSKFNIGPGPPGAVKWL